MRIKDLPKIEQPRERLIAKGPQNLKDEELLAILLGVGKVEHSAQDPLQFYKIDNECF